MSKVEGFKPRHKAAIEEIYGCECLLVDMIVVPHCDCIRHRKYGMIDGYRPKND